MSADQAEHGQQVGEREARKVAEEAREAGWDLPSFGKQQRYLPRCARGEISAFLLTEPASARKARA